MADANINIAANGNGDWPKETLDFMAPDGTHLVSNVEEMRAILADMGESVEHFRSLPAWPAMVGRNPWLKKL